MSEIITVFQISYRSPMSDKVETIEIRERNEIAARLSFDNMTLGWDGSYGGSDCTILSVEPKAQIEWHDEEER